MYKEVFRKRGLKRGIRHYSTPKLKHLNVEEIGRLKRLTHTWRVGDRYYKLAHKHYGSSKHWWVIAWYNKRPTEAHVKIGDIIYIPQPLEEVLKYMGL